MNEVATPWAPAMMYGKVVLLIVGPSIVHAFQVAPLSVERATWWRQSSPVQAYHSVPLGATATVGLFAPLAIRRASEAGPPTATRVHVAPPSRLTDRYGRPQYSRGTQIAPSG